ncbi:bifunctional diaminohydroxyphosphoribosylaminopyrimidine deaminase/5-amino-6-(5-phosphoribosylamino)uracil reductase RibD [Enterobacteriaceae endosymbiont of Donacia bicoloricornis]|uniref:bifunctional diaminohydroxyphosphoribosylaminopyrimidine deaminase/5-amino-6-(5-phosphoribosylamino)uracil reductase RibD n=1 Tax=Enterobacteriaceae endosymbiont of Donacia bicoloricornis TaxID=2675772 RepID=UPI00144966D8|nr:bifunctional diaminohydroxyphosphoribosylaminopyrimidine deaminase/5-amino-6-(5-phosphoribosylamino)uracil reductase RibD [Enterobacteriaceae endosymbiont of Donacia bicoloricornis]QJC37589.1 bifunctional diaminohydroxyphosphoribosylaminopyrimidine deaminase/5-amino-6-(5-phosphoribosylamino)uracil reductase RibD [Enterobacteriaceae endosymbiont of Donacia bicoloricornis]
MYSIDKFYMMYAIKLAKLGIFTTTPNPNVGCVIVNNKKIVGQGYHFKAGESHAEINALKIAGKYAKGSTVYVTLEPCNYKNLTPSCCKALINAKIKRLVVASKDPNPRINGKGLKYLSSKGIQITKNILSKKAESINYGFFKRMNTGIPWIQLKLASSLDGKIALLNSKNKWISSKISRNDVHKLRAKNTAILSTSKTILQDNSTLLVKWNKLNYYIKKRYPKKFLRQPIRIILDRLNTIKPTDKIILFPGKIFLIKSKYTFENWPNYVEQIIIPEINGYFNLKYLFKILGNKGINSVLIEAGSILSGYLIAYNLIDELIIYLTPKLLGNITVSLCSINKFMNIINVPNFYFTNVKKIGPDLKLILKPIK